VRLTVGAVKTQSRIIPQELNPEWNQVFAVGRDKIHGGTLELSVWDAVILYSSFLQLWKTTDVGQSHKEEENRFSLPADKCDHCQYTLRVITSFSSF
jgi:hypothetical protein